MKRNPNGEWTLSDDEICALCKYILHIKVKLATIKQKYKVEYELSRLQTFIDFVKLQFKKHNI